MTDHRVLIVVAAVLAFAAGVAVSQSTWLPDREPPWDWIYEVRRPAWH